MMGKDIKGKFFKNWSSLVAVAPTDKSTLL
jgi:hypothetical protein